MRASNRTFGITLAAIAIGMVGVSFASVPLYRLFCAVTGYDGTPQIGPAAAPGAVRQQRHGQRDEKDAHEVMRADIDRVEIERERQQHHGVDRAGCESDHHFGGA